MSLRQSRNLMSAACAVVCSSLAAPAFGQCTGFALTPSNGATIAPGTVDIGNHCDDCVTTVPLPFAANMYGITYNSIALSSNGVAQFTTSSNAYTNSCLPSAALGVAILPYWDDLRTDGAGEGIFTSVTGTAPNRVFNIEWRTHYFSGGGTSNFEVRLFEDQSHFEIVYGTATNTGLSATIGVQHTQIPPSQFECNVGGVTPGLMLSYVCTNDPLPPSGQGAAAPNNVLVCNTGGITLLTVRVTPGFNPASTGLTVAADLSAIGGAAAQPFFDDGTNGDATAGDNLFSYRATIPTSVATGPKSLAFTVRDAQNRSSSGGFGLTVNPCPTRGPDVFVAGLIDVANYGVVDTVTAFAVGTDACNNGDYPVDWLASVNQHPVIAQNMYRLKNGRFEQLGQSWLKHGFSSTNSGTCGTCQSPPLGGQQLGVSCSDAYGSGLNGSQGGLGPRSQVNPTTGAYPYPFTASAAPATIGRRLQVFTDDIRPNLNAGARYFVECHYVTSDDARWSNGGAPAINGLNNASYREISITDPAAVPAFVGATVRMKAAIQAWKDVDPAVTVAPADYLDTSLVATGIVARFWVGAKVTSNGNGTWHYEYAVHNLNADRAAASFSIPTGPGVVLSNIGFHGVFAHSGEPYPNSAANLNNWAGAVSNLRVGWNCPQPFVGPNGDNANALRWGTMYNFRFDANVPPITGGAGSVGLFKPGTPTSATAAGIPVPGRAACIADFDNGSATGVPDGGVGIEDLLYYLGVFEDGLVAADVDDGSGTGVSDGGVGIEDLLYYLVRFDAGC